MYVDLSELPKILFLIAVLGFLIAVFIAVRRRLRRRANQFGYHGILAYFRAVPQEDAEKRDAVDLALQGVVLCLLGVAYFPLMLIGIFPLYYGARKLMLLGLGLESHAPTVDREPRRSDEV
jgi:hypothetical protein